uniref:Zinc finger protein CONSTANS-like 16 n=1 Tax=Petunia hybrida TaxID=4102 RepID=A0A3T0YP55_PETHY|nr:zinc finger protein CONSTANS-like 16 [Petunia x hybrida]
MSSKKTLANAVGAKTARACDNCIRKRARWYCAADDAFLCQSCDSSVHSANPLARRHERVRLKTASFKSSNEFPNLESSNSVTSWHNGFTRKARTPRNGKNSRKFKSIDEEEIRNPIHLVVPEILSDENSHDENEEQFLYRVPTFDPNNGNEYSNEMKNDFSEIDMNRFHGTPNIQTVKELEEFAADVESLLGKGLDDEESFNYMEGLGFMEDCVKVENEGEVEIDMASTSYDNQVDYSEIDMAGETFELKFDYDSSIISFEEDINKGEVGVVMKNNIDDGKSRSSNILLNLDYGGVLNAWDDQRSPWTTGERPELDFNDCWPVCMGNCGKYHTYEDMEILKGHGPVVDEGREARVLRYREKRRTRLFSKKIRYEVRKLNAEKRPRMKGRFVKRANFAAVPIPFHK